MERTLKNYKGVLLFYFIIALLTLVCTFRLNTLNVISKEGESTVEKIYCA